MENRNNPFPGQRIVFFDGICILCNRMVDILLAKDRRNRLIFATLQSDEAKEFLQQIQDQRLKQDTVIFYDEGRFYIKSTAVIKIACYLGLPYSAFAMMLVIPRPWRDRIYDMTARKRAVWFGKREQCRIPDKETSGRIIG